METLADHPPAIPAGSTIKECVRTKFVKTILFAGLLALGASSTAYALDCPEHVPKLVHQACTSALARCEEDSMCTVNVVTKTWSRVGIAAQVGTVKMRAGQLRLEISMAELRGEKIDPSKKAEYFAQAEKIERDADEQLARFDRELIAVLAWHRKGHYGQK